MSPQHRLFDSIRTSGQTLSVVAMFNVAMGLVWAAFAVSNGDRLGMLVALVVISSAIVTTALFHAVSTFANYKPSLASLDIPALLGVRFGSDPIDVTRRA